MIGGNSIFDSEIHSSCFKSKRVYQGDLFGDKEKALSTARPNQKLQKTDQTHVEGRFAEADQKHRKKTENEFLKSDKEFYKGKFKCLSNVSPCENRAIIEQWPLNTNFKSANREYLTALKKEAYHLFDGLKDKLKEEREISDGYIPRKLLNYLKKKILEIQNIDPSASFETWIDKKEKVVFLGEKVWDEDDDDCYWSVNYYDFKDFKVYDSRRKRIYLLREFSTELLGKRIFSKWDWTAEGVVNSKETLLN